MSHGVCLDMSAMICAVLLGYATYVKALLKCRCTSLLRCSQWSPSDYSRTTVMGDHWESPITVVLL